MPHFSGIIPPVVTPLKAIDQLDVEATARVTEHLIAGGVNGLFVLGTTGEGPSLTYQIRYEMVERTCEVANERIPILVGITDCSLSESVHLAEHASACGAAAVVAAAPYYFATSQNGLMNWFRELADASPLPLLLYNMPGCVGIHIDLKTVEELSFHSNIIGIKDSSGDLAYFQTLCDQFRDDKDFVVFMGPEELIPEAVAAGADGGVCGGANLLPAVYVDLFDASKSENQAEVERLRNVVEQVFEHIYRDDNDQMNLIPALKFAMEQSGLCTRQVAPPLPDVSPAHQRQILDELKDVLELAESSLVTVSR